MLDKYIIIGLLVFLFLLMMWIYLHNIVSIRNESEYKDIVEYQSMLISNLLLQTEKTNPTHIPHFLKYISNIRYFPDQSGFFTVLDFTGKILVHGDYDGNLSDNNTLPFHIPIKEIIMIAQRGGGYIRYNYKGYIYQSFIYAAPNSSYIVCSGLFIDTSHIKERTKWKRTDKTILKQSKSSKSCDT